MNAEKYLQNKLRGLHISETEGLMKHMQFSIFPIINYENFLSNIMEAYAKEAIIEYTKFLQDKGYIDTDATMEEPYAIDEFLKQKLGGGNK